MELYHELRWQFYWTALLFLFSKWHRSCCSCTLGIYINWNIISRMAIKQITYLEENLTSDRFGDTKSWSPEGTSGGFLFQSLAHGVLTPRPIRMLRALNGQILVISKGRNFPASLNNHFSVKPSYTSSYQTWLKVLSSLFARIPKTFELRATAPF